MDAHKRDRDAFWAALAQLVVPACYFFLAIGTVVEWWELAMALPAVGSLLATGAWARNASKVGRDAAKIADHSPVKPVAVTIVVQLVGFAIAVPAWALVQFVAGLQAQPSALFWAYWVSFAVLASAPFLEVIRRERRNFERKLPDARLLALSNNLILDRGTNRLAKNGNARRPTTFGKKQRKAAAPPKRRPRTRQ